MNRHDLNCETVQLIINPHDSRRGTRINYDGSRSEFFLVTMPSYIAKALRLRASIEIDWYPDQKTWGDISKDG